MQSSGNDGGPNLTPLLDVVLQLIMFFMITVNFVRVEHFNDDIKLPTVQQARPLERSSDMFVFLNVAKDGQLVGKAEKLDTEARLKAHLQKEKNRLDAEAREQGIFNANITVVVRADADTKYADVYRVLDACSRAGYYSWQLRVLTQSR